MRKLIFKFIIGCVLLIAIDFCIGIICDRLLSDLPGRYSETSTIYKSIFDEEPGVLVLGSSTASHHYNTKILAEQLGEKAFNAGMDGRDIVYSDIVFQAVLSRVKPKYVIIDIGIPNLNGYWKKRIDCVRPYYGRSDVVTDYFQRESDWQQRIKLLSNTYRYNGTIHSLISLLLFDREPDTTAGYRPLVGSKRFEFKTESGFVPDAAVLKHLDNIVETCKKRGIGLVIVKSPHFVQNVTFNAWLKQYALDNNVKVFMECEDPYWNEHPELFYDGSHLNLNGADSMTLRVCKRIIEGI